MTDKQEMFCLEYLKDLNATQAAIRAGYSEDTAGSIGCENLTKPEIRARVRELMDVRSKDTLVDAYYIIQSLVENVNRCQQAVPVMVFDPVAKEMVQKREGDGNPVWEFDSSGANRALELLGKHLGVFEKDNNQKQSTINQEFIIKGEKFADKA